MTAENTALVVQIISLLIQVGGIGFVIFKVGKYVGGSEEVFKQFASHMQHDERRFEEISKTLTEIKISLAVVAKNGGSGR